LEPDPGESPETPTRFLRDPARSILTRNDSPDIPFDVALNPYRGCEHGCVYCYARPSHEYLGFSAGLDFESRILVKENAPALLRRELRSPRWKPQVIAMSGVTDPYQPVEKRLRLTRGCLEVLAEFRNPVGIVTKSRLVTRDADLLAELASHRAAAVWVSITTLDHELARSMEPRASSPTQRLRAIRKLTAAGVPVGVMVAPVVPGLTESEIPAIVQAARECGALQAGYITLKLAHGLGDLFEDWLDRNYPDRRNKVMNRIRHLRGGRLNDSRFGTRGRGEGLFAKEIEGLFDLACRKTGLPRTPLKLSAAAFRRGGAGQLSLDL